MSTVTRIADRFTLPQYEVVLDDGFRWTGGLSSDIPLEEATNTLVPVIETLRDLHKQSGRWNPSEYSKEEGTDSSGDKCAA